MMNLAYEQHTILHWVAYHQLVGFDAIWIYVDDRGNGKKTNIFLCGVR